MNDKSPNLPDGKPEGEMSARHEARLEAIIGNKLRSYYDELMAEPVPNRILDLLAQLEEKEQGNKEQDKPTEPE